MNQQLLRTARVSLVLAAASMGIALQAHAQPKLANQPVFSVTAVPGNMALALSVEYPTAVSNAHTDSTYAPASTYLGYFDPDKCYTYVYDSDELKRYFQPSGKTTGHLCSNKWSGNFLNWATMQTIDPFRWALTGGYRVTDTATTTIIEKAYATGQGGSGNFPDRSITTGSIVKAATPLDWSGMKIRIQGLGNKMRFTRSGDNNSGSIGPTPFNTNSGSWSDGTVWEVSVRVKVCDNAAPKDLEENCVAYGSNYKPEGLIQKYSSKMRFSAFGYLNDPSLTRDGAVLRASQKFVGPTEPVPGSDPRTNPFGEWSSTTGVLLDNPNKDDADSTSAAYGITIQNSGVINYLNKFGEIIKGSYKQYDPVGELHYAALRYFRNLGNVPEWSNPNTTKNSVKETYADGFPVITAWKDPILYQCQRNAILGIGDVNSHADRNLPGPKTTGSSEPTKPAAVAADTGFDALVWTNKVGQLNSGDATLGSVQGYGGCCNNNGALMAGSAYWANTQDIRPTMDGIQTVQTYWMDVLELQTYKKNNQFYLATKYGGAKIPDTAKFDPLGDKDLDKSWWHSGPDTDTVGGQLRPNNYYTAGRPDTMVSGLANAFYNAAQGFAAYTSSLNTTTNKVNAATKDSPATEAYGTSYDPNSWTGDIEANTVALMSTPIGYTSAWSFSAKLKAQMQTDGLGWDKRRRIVTYKPASNGTGSGVEFRLDKLTSEQSNALDTTYVSGNDATNYLKYVRGDQSLEPGTYRSRKTLIGDITNAQLVVLGPPQAVLSEASNPGYADHVKTYKSRPNILIAGANSGLVHIINGSTTSTDAGKELFAFIPNAAITGPSGTPSVDGIAAVGNPNYEHRFLVDARPAVAEVDFKRTVDSRLTTNEWHSIAVGGLGKGGRSIYALDLTTANEVTTEAMAASRVLWEYTDGDMGFSFGTPVITKTAQHGWVVVVGSGFNNTTSSAKGKGAFYILNARTGVLIQKVSLPTPGDDGTETSPANLAFLETYYRDRQDATVESIYAGDMNGNLWRLDLTTTSGPYPAPVKIAKLTDTTGAPLPITSAPTPVISPNSNRRWIAVGTGQLLSTDDVPKIRANRFYAILDGYQGRYTQSTDLPSGITMPFLDGDGRRDFQDITTTAAPLDIKTKVGYVLDLNTLGGVSGFRMIAEADAFENYVAFSPVRPLSTDPCNPGGTSYSAMFNLDTGISEVVQVDFAVDETRFVDDNGEIKLAVSGKPSPSTPGGGKKDGDFVRKPPGEGEGDKRLINWREIPLRN